MEELFLPVCFMENVYRNINKCEMFCEVGKMDSETYLLYV